MKYEYNISTIRQFNNEYISWPKYIIFNPLYEVDNKYWIYFLFEFEVNHFFVTELLLD